MNMKNGNLELLSPFNSAFLMIDFQAQLLFGVKSLDRDMLINNVTGLAKTAQTFDVPVIFSTIEASAFNGPLFFELQSLFPNFTPYDRTVMNAFEDPAFFAAVKKTGRKKLTLSAL